MSMLRHITGFTHSSFHGVKYTDPTSLRDMFDAIDYDRITAPVDSFSDLYMQTWEALAEYGINSVEDYRSCHDIGDMFTSFEELRAIEFMFANSCRELLPKLENKLVYSDGLSVIVDDENPVLSDDQRKKALLLANSTTLIAEEIRSPDFYDRSADPSDSQFISGPSIAPCLKLADRVIPEIRDGSFLAIPRSIESVDLVERTVHLLTRRSDEASAISAATTHTQLPPNLFKLSLSGKLFSDTNLLKLGIVLPSFENAPVESVRRVRNDYSDEFARFQRALAQMAWEFESNDDEQRMYRILERLSDEINQMQKAIKRIGRTHKHMCIGVGVVSVVFYLVLNDPKLTEQFHWAFTSIGSGAGVVGLMEYFRSIGSLNSKVDHSPFAFPLTVQKMCA